MGTLPRTTQELPRVPRVPPAPRSPVSLLAVKCIQQLKERESQLWRRDALRCAAGLGIVAAVMGIILAMVPWLLVHAVGPRPGETFDPVGRRGEAIRIALAIDGVMFLLTFFVAIGTRKESRADVANQFMEGCNRSAAGQSHPAVALLLILLMLGMLYGQFLLIDFLKSAWVRFRLRSVDRERAALVLGMLFSDPRGLDPSLLLRPGESVMELRRTIAYLILQEWVDISRDGHYLNLLSPSARALRS